MAPFVPLSRLAFCSAVAQLRLARRMPTMPPYADIYVLAEARTEAAVAAFLEHFAPVREETADEYWIPKNADVPQKIFHVASEVVSFCCTHPSEAQAVYWRRVGDGDPAYAMVFFTPDARLIFGLSVSEDSAECYLAELRRHARSEIGYITVENPPPETAAEFCQIADDSSA
jgi:hypothetical protein